LNVRVIGHQEQQWNFSTLSEACVQFMFGKTSLASSFVSLILLFCDSAVKLLLLK